MIHRKYPPFMDVSLGSTVHVLYAEEEEVPSKETECEENREKVIN